MYLLALPIAWLISFVMFCFAFVMLNRWPKRTIKEMLTPETYEEHNTFLWTLIVSMLISMFSGMFSLGMMM